MADEIQSIKQRFGIIGNTPELNYALSIAARVAPTNLTVLITGESGVGKEIFSQIIHQYSARKHGCLLYTSPSPRDRTRSRMPSSA